MFRIAIVFLVITLGAAFLGFGGVAPMSWEGARILFVLFLVLSLLAFLVAASRQWHRGTSG